MKIVNWTPHISVRDWIACYGRLNDSRVAYTWEVSFCGAWNFRRIRLDMGVIVNDDISFCVLRSVESFKEVCVLEKNADMRILQDKLLWMALMGW